MLYKHIVRVSLVWLQFIFKMFFIQKYIKIIFFYFLNYFLYERIKTIQKY